MSGWLACGMRPRRNRRLDGRVAFIELRSRKRRGRRGDCRGHVGCAIDGHSIVVCEGNLNGSRCGSVGATYDPIVSFVRADCHGMDAMGATGGMVEYAGTFSDRLRGNEVSLKSRSLS